MVKPKYRVRVRVVNLSARAGEGVPRFTLQAWRATFILNGQQGDTVLDGTSIGGTVESGGGVGSPVTITVGGVFMPDGTPAVLDQEITLGRASKFFGTLVLEYLEPIK